ncbi:suppressor of fused domain protein [Kitasatospora sp. NPDC088134]|uniref:suppressor of fused domain protein n=1 Tax=Kitasatospora sp. NPDC088134 TaxID=3364071 RepID=UPI003828478A
MASRIEKYLAHLDRLSGGREPRFFPVHSTRPGLPGVTEIVYDDLPAGLLTAFTYGLSAAEHPDRPDGAPELCLSVNSTDVIWAHAVGHLAEQLRGTCPFVHGSTINFGERIAPGSEMTAFCVLEPPHLDRADRLGIDVGPPGHEGHDLIDIRGLQPIHEIERQFIAEHGFEAFRRTGWDPTDVLRRPAV